MDSCRVRGVWCIDQGSVDSGWSGELLKCMVACSKVQESSGVLKSSGLLQDMGSTVDSQGPEALKGLVD